MLRKYLAVYLSFYLFSLIPYIVYKNPYYYQYLTLLTILALVLWCTVLIFFFKCSTNNISLLTKVITILSLLITQNDQYLLLGRGVGGSEDLEGHMVIAVCHSRSSQWQLWNLNYKKQNELFELRSTLSFHRTRFKI